jgi:hypothetical protein
MYNDRTVFEFIEKNVHNFTFLNDVQMFIYLLCSENTARLKIQIIFIFIISPSAHIEAYLIKLKVMSFFWVLLQTLEYYFYFSKLSQIVSTL